MPETLKTTSSEIIHDEAEARFRIENRPRDFYGIRTIEDLRLTDDDLMFAEVVCDQESEIVYAGGRSITNEGLFRAVSYCLLTPMQQFDGQSRGFEALFSDNQPGLWMDRNDLGQLLNENGVLFHQQKADYICRSRDTMTKKDVLPIIRGNLNTTREIEEIVRDIISSEFDGLGPKSTSLLLRMCGAKYLIPMDSWMMEILYFHGYPCEITRKKVERERWETKDRTYLKQRKTGLTRKQYFQAEKFTLDLAQKYKVPGYILQAAFWAKHSSFSSASDNKI